MDKDSVRIIAEEKINEFLKGDETYTVHGPYLRSDGRQHAVVVTKHLDGAQDKRTVSWPKLIAEILLDGDVWDNDTVDHVDRNFSNDDVFNLRVVSRSRHAKEDALHVHVESVICPECQTFFTPSVSQRNEINKAGPFCSRKCTGKYGARVQNGGEIIKRQEIVKKYYLLEK